MDEVNSEEWLVGGGEIGAIIRSRDWASSCLGPRASWPGVLRTVVDLVVGNAFPMALLWGPDWLLLHNDAYRPIAAAMPSQALGHSMRASWHAHWHLDETFFAAVMERGETVTSSGTSGRARFTLCHSPVHDGRGSIAGMLVTLQEIARQDDTSGERGALLRAITNESSDVIFAKDRQGRLTYANPATLVLIGKPLDAVLGKTDAELLGDTTAAREVMDNDRRIMEGGTAIELEERVPLPDGTRRVWLSKKTAYRDPHGHVAGLLGISRDITDRKLADEALRLSEERLRSAITSLTVERRKLEAIIKALPVGIVITERDGAAVSMNDAALRLHGFETAADMHAHFELYKDSFELRHMDGRLLPMDEWPAAKALHQEYVTGLEVRLRNVPAGSEKITAYSAFPVQDETGATARLVYLMVDITERKETEVALRQAADEIEARAQTIKAITDNASLGLLMMDAEHRCTFMNPAAETIVGYTFSELQAFDRPLHDIIHHTHPDGSPFPIDECPIDRALPTRLRERGEDVFVRRDGSFYPVAFTASPIFREGVAIGTIIELEDTTVRKQHERDLRASTERVELLARATSLFMETKLDVQALLERLVGELVPAHAESAVVTLLSKDKRTRDVAALKHADPTAQEMLTAVLHDTGLAARYGLTAEEVQRGEPLLLQPVPIGELERSSSPRLRDYLARFPVGSLMAIPLRTARGVLGALRLARSPGAAPFSDVDQAIFQDIADRAALSLEAALRFAEAEQAIRLRDDFLSIASHELRTPLTALQLQLQSLRHLLAKEELDLGGARLARKVESSNRQADRLVALVEDLLDVSRLSLGKLGLHREKLDLAELAREVVERHASQSAAAGCTLGLEAQAICGEWDRLRLEQVLTNLIANAIKYGAGKPVDVTVSGSGAVARFSVRDHGIGIHPDDLDRIFGRFERAVSGRHYGGLGLGLFISKQIIEAHGGVISAQSEPERGSTFHVTLPTSPTTDTVLVEVAGNNA